MATSTNKTAAFGGSNPQVYVETPLHPEKLTVWCALWAEKKMVKLVEAVVDPARQINVELGSGNVQELGFLNQELTINELVKAPTRARHSRT
ncbi:hypothetical protein TNCV_3022851 [Trichonephila clavipes]|nr:hypothetical protein TNCV_3022851 [Trichonephila clavipes]